MAWTSIQRQEVSGSEIWHLQGVAKLSDEQLDEELRGAGLQNSRGGRQVLTPPRNRLRFPSFSCNVIACELRKRRNHRNWWHCHILSLRIKSDATHLPSLQESTCLQQPPELRRHRVFRIFPIKIGTRSSKDHIFHDPTSESTGFSASCSTKTPHGSCSWMQVQQYLQVDMPAAPRAQTPQVGASAPVEIAVKLIRKMILPLGPSTGW